MEIKEILKEERKKRGLTQEIISQKMGIARASYAKYETGANKPSRENMMKLADIFNLPVDYLLGRKLK